MLYHKASEDNIVGTLVNFDYNNQLLSSQVGAFHRFDEKTSIKAKANNLGEIEALVKHACSEHLSVVVKTAFTGREISDGRGAPLKFGLGLEITL